VLFLDFIKVAPQISFYKGEPAALRKEKSLVLQTLSDFVK
jgi:hypothetical protein